MQKTISNEGFDKVGSTNIASIVSATHNAVSSYLLLQIMEQNQSVKQMKVMWKGAQASAHQLRVQGQQALNEGIAQAVGAGISAGASLACVGKGVMGFKEYDPKIQEEQVQIKKLNDINAHQAKPITGNVVDEDLANEDPASLGALKTDLIKNSEGANPGDTGTEPVNYATNSRIRAAIHSMDEGEYAEFKDNLRESLNTHRNALAGYQQARSTALQTTWNMGADVVKGAANAGANGVSGAFKQKGLQAQAAQTVDNTAKEIAQQNYNSDISRMAELRNNIEAAIQQGYAGARAYYPQQA